MQSEEAAASLWATTIILASLPLFFLLLLKWWNDVVYVLPVKLRSRGGGELPPGSMGVPFFGEMLHYMWYFKAVGRPDDFITSKRKKYGDGVGLYRTHLFGSPAIISCSPAANKFILQSSESFALRWPTVELVGALSVLQGKQHARLKGFVLNAVNKPDALRRIAPLAQPRMVAVLESWAEKGRIVALRETRKMTLENWGRLFASLEPGPTLDYMGQLIGDVVKGYRANPSNVPGSACRRAVESRKKLLAIYRERLEMRKKHTEDSERAYDLMDGLMSVQDEEGNKLSDEEIVDNTSALVIAGYESSSLSAMWVMYCLAKAPDVVERLRAENLALREKKKGEFITSEDVSSLKFTNMVVEETLRMANISGTVFRIATRDVEYKGYKFPKGWRVIPWLRYSHTNPEYFEDPLRFNPDRWNVPAKPGTYQAFGGGPRICPGNMFAKMIAAIFIHHLTIGYKWELVNPDAKIDYLPHPKPSDLAEVTFSRL